MTALSPPLSFEATAHRHLVGLAGAWAAILLLFRSDVADLATIWWTSSTFNHCLLIPLIIAWLVWQRLPALREVAPREVAPRGWVPGLLPVAIGAMAWLLGEAAGVAIARHLGIVLMLQGSVIAILGPEIARGLTFPLAYMLFLVPVGEELVPPLQTLTARMCMALLDLVDVPAHIEGIFITIPNGWFEVAEACSGVKFLVAMAAYGVLAANICFKSWPRRIVFVAAALVIPVVANGIRAWGTIYVAHRTNAHFAMGFDHVLYGWIFFAIVIALLMGGSWRWFDRPAQDVGVDPARLRAPVGARDQLRPAVLGALFIASFTVAWSTITSSGEAKLPATIDAPEVAGWKKVGAPVDWRANFTGANRMLLSRYVDRQGRVVDLTIALFASQSEGRELVGYGQGAVPAGSHWAWTDDTVPPPDGHAFRITGRGGVVRDVVVFYRVGDVTTGSELRVKTETLKVRLLGGRKRAAAVIVSAPQTHARQSARPAIDAFLAGLGPIGQVVDRLSGEMD